MLSPKLFLALAFFALATALAAQRNNTGYVIAAAGDTLRGYFDFSRPGAASSTSLQVVFCNGKTGEIKKYAPFQIKGWQLDTDSIFNEAKVLRWEGAENGYGVFMRRISGRGGEIACYLYTDISGTMPRTIYYIEKEQKLYEVKSGKKFYTQLAELLKDSPEVSKKISERLYKGNQEKRLREITQDYNNWFENQWN